MTSPVPFLLRPARGDDAEGITKVFIHTREVSWTFLKWTYDQSFMLGLFRDEVLPKQTVWVAENETGILGFMALEGEELDRLYVMPEMHHQGIGRALLEKAKTLNPEGLCLWVFQENHQARGFYEHHGFVLQHLTDGSDNMEKCPDARYVWRPA